MISLRAYLGYNISIIALLAWRVHQGMPTRGAITVGFWSLVVADGSLAIKWLRTRNKPKAVTLERSPWHNLGHAVAIGVMVLIVVRRYGTADLVFLAILGFVLTVAFWLWDRYTLRRDGQSEQ